MNVKELKAFLKNVDDETLVVVPGHDHSYRHTHAYTSTAIKSRYGMSEDFSSNSKLEEGESRINVLVFS